MDGGFIGAEHNSSTDEKQSRGLQMSATRGGRRPGAGRKPGGRNKATIEREMLAKNGIEVARNAGLMPIDVMLARMRGELLPNGRSPTDEQFQAAVAAAPFLHPRLSAVAFQEGKSRARFDTSVLSQQERVQL